MGIPKQGDITCIIPSCSTTKGSRGLAHLGNFTNAKKTAQDVSQTPGAVFFHNLYHYSVIGLCFKISGLTVLYNAVNWRPSKFDMNDVVSVRATSSSISALASYCDCTA